MFVRKVFFLWVFVLFVIQSLCATPLAEQFKQAGYVEICDQGPAETLFDSLYASFDELIDFLQTNLSWTQKIYCAKERFIRSKERRYYSTDVFGFYDESEREGRSQVSFYYSTHFHEFISAHYPQFNEVPQIIDFLETCLKLQEAYGDLFNEAAAALGLSGPPPILFKIIKYLPSYVPTRPHYDGSLFSLFLHSTDNASLLLSPYKSSFSIEDFSSPPRTFSRGHILIPGTLLTEFSITPTPHVVAQSGKTRYATIAFAMRENYTAQKIEYSPLPSFNQKQL